MCLVCSLVSYPLSSYSLGLSGSYKFIFYARPEFFSFSLVSLHILALVPSSLSAIPYPLNPPISQPFPFFYAFMMALVTEAWEIINTASREKGGVQNPRYSATEFKSMELGKMSGMFIHTGEPGHNPVPSRPCPILVGEFVAEKIPIASTGSWLARQEMAMLRSNRLLLCS